MKRGVTCYRDMISCGVEPKEEAFLVFLAIR